MSIDLKEIVQEKYGEAARRVGTGAGLPADCCSKTSCCEGAASSACDPITSDLYDKAQKSGVPEKAILASLGCGNPTALAELKPGETVLDLGSGGGIDVLLSAKRVGPNGKAYGLDMTDDMLALARENQRKAGIENIEFLKGEIENIPLPDNSIDVIISNCVINLVPDKAQVFREAFRVLKPGGRVSVSDVLNIAPLPDDLRADPALLCGCIAGAISAERTEALLREAGFVDVAIAVKPESRETVASWAPGRGIENCVASATIEARKPRNP